MSYLASFDAEAVRAALPWERAITGIEEALRADVDPEVDAPRLFSPTVAPGGEFLIMPTTGTRRMGVKVATISPENSARGLQKIQGAYLLFDADTSAPLAVMDGLELTAIRTPATTVAALRGMAASAPVGGETPERPAVVIFGAGIQALNHLRALAWAWPGASFSIVGRSPERVAELVEQAAAEGFEAAAADDVGAAVRAADIVVTVTSSPTPVFDGSWPRDGALIASVGQHGLDAREVDATLVLRSDVVVEGRASAQREAGDLIPARSAEEWERIAPPNLRDLVVGGMSRRIDAPALYSGVGMAWEDLALAELVYEGKPAASAA